MGDPIKSLLKKTIRRMCREERKERRKAQGRRRIGFHVYKEPQIENAVLYCPDKEEFTRCRRSG